MKANETEWTQKLILKDQTGRELMSHEWQCVEDDETNTDGLVEAVMKIQKVCPSLRTVFDDDDEYDDLFDAVVTDHKSWTGYGFTIELDPVDRI